MAAFSKELLAILTTFNEETILQIADNASLEEAAINSLEEYKMVANI